MTPLSGAVLTAAEMRAAEQASGVPLDELMQRAGAAIAEAAWRFGNGAPVLVICGPGNNGGDGYVAARLLRARGATVRVAASGSPSADLAKAAAARWGEPVEPLGDALPAPVLVDALFGTGLTRALSAELAEPLRRLAKAAHFVIAADLPSGVGTDDGTDLGAVRADLTIALGAAKPAHLLQPGASLCGTVLVENIGINVAGKVDVLARPLLAAPTAADHKYSRGMVAIVAGDMPGAATLGATAAARIAGYTILCGTGDAPASVVRRNFRAALGDPRLSAMLIGPGMADTPDNRAKLEAALAFDVPLVLDAGALALVEPEALAARTASTILTPHLGEFVRLFGEGTASKIDRARDAARRARATIVFKGADTVIASPDGRVTLAPAASSWLASAGTGDVLAGIMASALARGLPPHTAACAAVWLHGEAARRAGPGLIADDLERHLPAALAGCL